MMSSLSPVNSGFQQPPSQVALSQPMTDTVPLAQEFSEFLSVRDVARYLGIATVSVYRLVERRAIPVYRVLRKLLFRRCDVSAWIETKRTEPRSTPLCQ